MQNKWKPKRLFNCDIESREIICHIVKVQNWYGDFGGSFCFFFQIQNSSKMTVQVIAGINILSYVQIGKPTQNALYKFHRKWYKSIGFWKMFMQLIISIVSRFEWCGAQCTHTQLSVLVSKHYGLSYIFCINKSYLYILMYSVVLSKTYAFCFSTSRSLFAFLHPSRWGKKNSITFS